RILEVAEAVEGVHGLGELVVGFCHQVVFQEWGRKIAGILRQRGANQHRSLLVLQGALAVQKIEKLVLDEGSAEPASVLRTLKRRLQSRRGWQGCCHRAIAEQPERFAVNVIGSGASGHVDGARGSQFVGEIEARLAELELFNAAGGNVSGGSADGFVGNIDAIDLNAGSTPEAA